MILTRYRRYRHKLTNAESTEPPSELGGGILADDMGMGKTLSTLALITETLEEAREWFRGSSNISRKPRSKATLIIVPSTRKITFISHSYRTFEIVADGVVQLL